jgi:hypothetical protein
VPNHHGTKQRPRPACPSCGSSLGVVRVTYGSHTANTVETLNERDADAIGAMKEEAPHWFCEECQTHFGKITDAA